MSTIDYADTWDRTEVWWDDKWKLWGVTAYTADGDQVGATEWCVTRSEAIDDASAYIESGRCKRTVVYTKAGNVLQVHLL